MPLHERAQLRAAAILQLIGAEGSLPSITYATAAGARVTSSRRAPNDTDELPCISVYTDSEQIDPASQNTNPRELKRRPVLAIEAWVKVPAGGDVDAALDAIALEIETAMDGDDTLDDTASESILESTETGVKLDGARPMGCIRLEYATVYRTDLRIAEPEDDFDEAATDYSLNGEQPDEDDQAHDLVEDIHE